MISAARSAFSVNVSCTRNHRGSVASGHVAVHAVQADRRPLLPHGFCEVGNQHHVARGGKAGFLGPCRKRTCVYVIFDAGASVLLVVVARIRFE
jgi:hypothetical protein